MMHATSSTIGSGNRQTLEALVLDPTQQARTVQRGLDEALACRDMLAAAPAKPPRISQLVAAFGALARRLKPRKTESAASTSSSARHQSGQFGHSRANALPPAPSLDMQRQGGSR
jgi:hypothetical protein